MTCGRSKTKPPGKIAAVTDQKLTSPLFMIGTSNAREFRRAKARSIPPPRRRANHRRKRTALRVHVGDTIRFVELFSGSAVPSPGQGEG